MGTGSNVQKTVSLPAENCAAIVRDSDYNERRHL